MRKFKILLPAIGAAWLFLLGPGLAWAQTPGERIVSPEWLEANKNRADVRLIDMRGDVRDYWEAHIPGAVYLNSESLRWPADGVPGMAMPPQALALLLGNLGIGRDTAVVIYSEVNHYRATYFAWLLDLVGHPSWHILEGGFDNWKAAGRPVSQDYPKIAPAGYRLPGKMNNDVLATLEQVRDRDPKRTVLFDTRPPDLYAGEKGTWKRRGHIKGAINRFWTLDLNADGSWRDIAELKTTYAELGATPDKTIIVSCGQGLMSSHTYITLKYILGFPHVRNYDGSFSQWSVVDALPVERKK